MPPDPPLTKRQQIVNALILRLKAISTETTLPDGFTYQTNLGERPIEEWPTDFDQEETPALGIFDLVASKPQQEIREGRVTNTLPIQVRLFNKREDTPATLRTMLGDIERALITDAETGLPDPSLTVDGNRLLIDMQSNEVGFIVPKDTFQIDGAAVGFDVLYLTKPFDAYE